MGDVGRSRCIRGARGRDRHAIGVVPALVCALACASAGPGTRRTESEADADRLSALREAGAPARVVLVTLAGLESEDFLAPSGFVAAEGDPVRMPTLARLAAEGAFGVRATPPAPGSSAASHASLVTGLRPDRHGVVADETIDPAGDRAVPFHDSRLLQATTLWDAALGRGVLALGWPTTDGARIELLIPDAEPDDPDQDWLGFIRRRSTPQLSAALEAIVKAQREAAPPPAKGAAPGAVRWPDAGQRDDAFVSLACEVAASDRNPALWLIRLAETAAVLDAHGYGTREHAAALRRADDRLARLIDCLGAAGRLADTALVVAGDVAHRPVHTEIAPNVALVREKLIGRDPRSKTGVRSWLALARSHGRSAYVFAKDAQNAVAARRVLEAEGRRSGSFDVVPAADLAEQGADREAWFGLAARPGFAFGNALTGPLLRPSERRSAAGGFPFRDGAEGAVGVVAWGRGVRGQVRLPALALVDVAPTIAALLGLRLDDKPDGQPLTGLLRARQALPPPGPKRIQIGDPRDVDRTLRELGGGRELGSDP